MPISRTNVAGSMTDVNALELRVALVRAGVPQWRLAADLGLCPSSFSAVVNGRAPAPPGLVSRVEEALGLTPGTLSPRGGQLGEQTEDPAAAAR